MARLELELAYNNVAVELVSLFAMWTTPPAATMMQTTAY